MLKVMKTLKRVGKYALLAPLAILLAVAYAFAYEQIYLWANPVEQAPPEIICYDNREDSPNYMLDVDCKTGELLYQND